jgi:hypothetical protein
MAAQIAIKALVNTVKAHLFKADQCSEKSSQHQISAGLRLGELKIRHAELKKKKHDDWVPWAEFAEATFGLKQSRTDELIRIGVGTTNIEQTRTANAGRMKKSRAAKSASRDADNSKPVAALAAPAATSDACDEMPDVKAPEGTPPPELRRFNFIYRCSEAIAYGKQNGFDDAESHEITDEIIAAARHAADVWSALVFELVRRRDTGSAK